MFIIVVVVVVVVVWQLTIAVVGRVDSVEGGERGVSVGVCAILQGIHKVGGVNYR